VTLRWAKPATDGGRPITHYTIEMKDKLSPDWQQCAKTDGPDCEWKVDELREKQVYEFRVIAHNKAGPSEPSDSTGQHVVKHRNRKL